ncbi:hypothetical protein [Olleya sp. R77988]|uniref:hypothetical protein n=1 Tax=Olleya sp. R77988 TaxID=3093875 RepID=UPI0037C7FBF7
MKKIYAIMFTVFLNATLFSCTPTSVAEDVIENQQAENCCGEEGELDPPPIVNPIGGKTSQAGN